MLADDLTGALDAAAPFAQPGHPVRLPWRGTAVPDKGSVAVTSESRNAGVSDATARAITSFRHLAVHAGPADLWFKKVDSVLRGHPVAEVAAIVQAGGFRRCIFAPAFPEMGRVTRGGRQFVSDGGGPAQAVGPADLHAAFEAAGLVACADGDHTGTGQVVIADAETPEDLARVASRWRTGPDTLWAGSRGLARALAGPTSSVSLSPISAVIIGTTHPATRAQAERVRSSLSLPPERGPFGLTAERPLLIDPVPQWGDAKETRQALADLLARLIGRETKPTSIVVVGGDTLATALDAFRASGLDCLGEVSPGIPLSRVVGGNLDAVTLATKSGGFGDRDLLRRLVTG